MIFKVKRSILIKIGIANKPFGQRNKKIGGQFIQ